MLETFFKSTLYCYKLKSMANQKEKIKRAFDCLIHQKIKVESLLGLLSKIETSNVQKEGLKGRDVSPLSCESSRAVSPLKSSLWCGRWWGRNGKQNRDRDSIRPALVQEAGDATGCRSRVLNTTFKAFSARAMSALIPSAAASNLSMSSSWSSRAMRVFIPESFASAHISRMRLVHSRVSSDFSLMASCSPSRSSSGVNILLWNWIIIDRKKTFWAEKAEIS